MTERTWVFQRGILYVMDFGQAAPAAVAPRIAVRFAEVERDSLEPLARAMEVRDASEFGRRFETGRRCFAGWLENEIVAYGWVSQRDEGVGELERVYRLQPSDAYIWNCATLPRQRGHGLYGALLSFITVTLRGEGVQRVWMGSNLENHASLRGFARVGYQPIMQVAYVRLLDFCCLWMQSQPSAPDALVTGARHMLIAPHERAWRSVAVGLRSDWSSAQRVA